MARVYWHAATGPIKCQIDPYSPENKNGPPTSHRRRKGEAAKLPEPMINPADTFQQNVPEIIEADAVRAGRANRIVQGFNVIPLSPQQTPFRPWPLSGSSVMARLKQSLSVNMRPWFFGSCFRD